MNFRTVLLFFSFLLVYFTVHAQKNQSLSSKWNNDISIDGNLSEWGDSLRYYFEDQDLHYSFSNDDRYLYVAIKVKNKEKQTQAAFNGISLTINKEGKKKEGPKFSFPIPDRSALRALSNQEFDRPTDIREAALSTLRSYYVRNFPNILDGSISLENSYGIKAAVLIDTADHLCYESAIRLDQLGLAPHQKNVAINLKINGLLKNKTHNPGTARNRRSSPYGYDNYYGYNDRPRTIITNREEPGTWQIITLATKAH